MWNGMTWHGRERHATSSDALIARRDRAMVAPPAVGAIARVYASAAASRE